MSWEDSPGNGLHPNLEKFLGFLGKAEGADYNTIVGGSSFDDFSRHPSIVGLRTKEGPSTAAGRYQITKTTYDDVAPKIGITDFSRQSQDLIATELIRRNGALEDVIGGNYEQAIKKLGGTWASLPSSPYSQPKRDWNFVRTNLAASTAGWEDAPKAPNAPQASGGGWEDAPGPRAPAQATPTAAAAPRSVGRRIDDFVRGVADTVTFGYADELSAKADAAVKNSALNKWLIKNYGINLSQSGADTYDQALTAQRQRDKEGGGERIAGQVVGALAPTIGVVRSVDGATRLARAGAGATTGAIQGGLYGTGASDGGIEDRLKAGALGAGVGALTGGALGAVIPATVTQKGNSLIKSAGSKDAARFDAEIIKDLEKLSTSPTKRGNPLTTIDANAIETKYINDVNAALKQLGKTQDVTAVREAILNRRALTPDDLSSLRGTAAGNATADAIEKAQRLRSLTQPTQSSGGVMPLVREVNRWILPDRIATPVNAVLGGRQTREVAIQKALKQVPAAENVLERFGPSRATRSMERLGGAVEQAQKAVAAQRATQEAARLAQSQQNASTRLQVLKDTRRPLSGAFQELLTGGASNLNLSSKEAIDALRLVSRQQKDGPVGEAASQILRSGNVPNKDAFYGLQNQLRKLQEGGVISGQPGALSDATASVVRNPISYAEAVRTAGAAADLARSNAPSKELAQFATRVAGIKSPDAKAKAVADRLAKSSDPAEQAFLKQFVEPLAQFGKK